MREITLFRGKRTDNGEWAYGGCVAHGFEKYIFPPEEVLKGLDYCGYLDCCRMYEVIPKTVGLYTGLNDRNGTEIFEGDVCRFREWDNGDWCWVGKVLYDHQMYIITGPPNKACITDFELMLSRFIPKNIEVIGNIYDNPELLEVK